MGNMKGGAYFSNLANDWACVNYVLDAMATTELVASVRTTFTVIKLTGLSGLRPTALGNCLTFGDLWLHV